MDSELEQWFRDAVWIGRSLFDRNKTSGSSANMSFRFGDRIFITASGSCFGRLERGSFTEIDGEGRSLDGKKPSKEYPLHLMMYQKDGDNRCVIHVHSTYAVLWSCLQHAGGEADVIPDHTPYLRMKVGRVGLVPYAVPGSQELFDGFRERLEGSDAFLLQNHGPVVAGRTVMDAFYAVEELEESAKIAWML